MECQRQYFSCVHSYLIFNVEPLFFLVKEQHAVSKIKPPNETPSEKESQNEIIFKGINKIEPCIS